MAEGDEVMCLQKVLQPGVSFRSCSWKPSGQLHLSCTKQTQLSFLSLTFLLPPISPSAQSFSLFLFHNFCLPSIYLHLLPHYFSLIFSHSKKISYSLMHGSCREQCYFIFPWQQSLCFSRSHYSFGSNVLLCQQ